MLIIVFIILLIIITTNLCFSFKADLQACYYRIKEKVRVGLYCAYWKRCLEGLNDT